ncbi:unnamed protein product [marine sediment metagenome]|uniref:Uncharacterized protein n=1 Tax=marine sediment metagenome TaxID=412755 RepID=X0X2W4_9ZZZZ
MKIQADQEGINGITEMVDAALKRNGLANFNTAQAVLGSIKPIEEKEKEDTDGEES